MAAMASSAPASSVADDDKVVSGTGKVMKNAVVVMVGVSEYDKSFMPSLDGVIHDYHHIWYTMNYLRGYSMIFFDKNNKLCHIDNKSEERLKCSKIGFDLNDKDNSKAQYRFKLRWNKGEIDRFNNEVLKAFDNNLKEWGYDGLIYVISGHGDSENIFYDSNGNELNLYKVFFDRFENSQCKYFVSKPKIFLIDCCRGQVLSKKLIDSRKEEMKTAAFEDKDDKKEKNQSNQISDYTEMVTDKQDNNDATGSYSESGDMRMVFANTEGKKSADGTKGGYFLNAITKTLNRYFDKNARFGRMLQIASNVLNKNIGSVVSQVIVDKNLFNYFVIMQSKDPKFSTFLVKSEATLLYDGVSDKNKEEDILIASSLGVERRTVSSKNPLIVIMGIGLYNPNLKKKENKKGIKNDYKEIIQDYHFVNGYKCYDIVYANEDKNDKKKLKRDRNVQDWDSIKDEDIDDDEFQSDTIKVTHLTKDIKLNDFKNKDINFNFKLYWTEEDIMLFNEYINENILINNEKLKYDGLLYFITGNDGYDNILYTSDNGELAIDFIHCQYNNRHCRDLRKLPKIFFIDVDRGNKQNVVKNNGPNNEPNNENKKLVKTKKVEKKQLSLMANDEKTDEAKADNNNNNNVIDASKYSMESGSQYREHSDLRMIYSTANGYKTIRNEKNGQSLLIQALGFILNQKTYNTQIFDKILLAAKGQMMKKAQDMNQDEQQLAIIDDNNSIDYDVLFAKDT